MSKPRQRALDAAANADIIALSGITFPFDIFGRYNPTTGEDLICCALKNERNNFELELQAQRHGKSVHDHLYAKMLPHLKARGCNTPLDCFFVTIEPPDDIDPGTPSPRPVTIQ